MEGATENQTPTQVNPTRMGKREFFRRVAEPGRKVMQAFQTPEIPSNKSSLQRYFREREISRRNFIGKAIALGIFVTTGLGLVKKAKETSINPLPWVQPVKQETIPASQTPELSPNFPLLNDILPKRLGSKDRFVSEQKYVKEAQTIEQVDFGFYAVTDKTLRAILLDKRYTLRLKDKEKYRQLTPEELDWAKTNKVHPEVLAICTDYYFAAKQMLEVKLIKMGKEEFFKWFRPDLFADPETKEAPLHELTIEDLLPNPGILVGLMLKETGATYGDANHIYGGVFIGEKPALELLAKEPEAIKGMINLYQDLNKLGPQNGVPLKYDVNQIPAGPTGDIGTLQFRPDTALREHAFLRDNFAFYLHPLSLKAVIAAAIFIAHGYNWGEKKEKNQYGFISGELKKISNLTKKLLDKFKRVREASFDKWNSNMVKVLLEWGRKYQEDIIDTGIFAQIDRDYQS